jgi:hypothetical protein
MANMSCSSPTIATALTLKCNQSSKLMVVRFGSGVVDMSHCTQILSIFIFNVLTQTCGAPAHVHSYNAYVWPMLTLGQQDGTTSRLSRCGRSCATHLTAKVHGAFSPLAHHVSLNTQRLNIQA